MVRTQIQLTEDQARRLRALARQQRVSLAEVIRRFVDQGLREQDPGRAHLFSRAELLIGRFPDRERAGDLATDHDRYLDEGFE